MSKDIAVGAVGVVDGGMILAGALNKNVSISNKPAYLVTLIKDNPKSKTKFITLDKPELLNGFIQVRGIFTNSSEEEIIKNFSSILTSTDKELFSEVWFPWHKVSSVRSLVFRQK